MKWVGAMLAMWALVQSGCLIPQDDTLFSGIPEPLNRPPRIVENQVSPQTRILRDFGSETCRTAFEVLVTDPDVDDEITVYWYVDYAPGSGPASLPRFFQFLPQTGNPLRNERATFEVDLAAAGSPLASPGLHLVEAIVADRPLDPATREPRLGRDPNPDGGAPIVVDEGFAVSYAWVVETVAGACQ
jgi:hypothetical protein